MMVKRKKKKEKMIENCGVKAQINVQEAGAP